MSYCEIKWRTEAAEALMITVAHDKGRWQALQCHDDAQLILTVNDSECFINL
jgi:hypothetical protein